jgi:hypothetical protein
VPSARISSGELSNRFIGSLLALRRVARRYSCSLTGKYALIGLTCDTEVRWEFGPTRLPSWI